MGFKPRYSPRLSIKTLLPRRKSVDTPGTAPGFTAHPEAEQTSGVRIDVHDYNRDTLNQHLDTELDQCKAFSASPNTTWIDVQGTPDAQTLLALSDMYGLHTLALEDVANVGQRPKVDAYDDQAFIVLNIPVEQDGVIKIEQVSLFLGATYVVSFCESSQQVFEPIKQRIRAKQIGRLRQNGPDFLCYAIVDLVIDSGFPLLDKISEHLDQLTDSAFNDPSHHTLERIHELRHTLIALRRGLSAHRDVVNTLIRDERDYIKENTVLYLRDCYDHAIRVNESIENYRELISSTQDLYMSSISHRMNDVMKVLTIISTIFIPLSFFTGLYGMNFSTDSPWNMPELSHPYGYPILLTFLAALSIGMVVFFKRKKWW